jgi:6-phosphofructokinase 1
MRIAVLTSGGDAPGMNAALRGAVRQALAAGHEVVGVREGYAGLVAGGEHLFRCGFDDVAHTLGSGGTVFGTARAPVFRTEQGRRAAVEHLVAAGVQRLVVIGGDGSLTGARVLCREWRAHLDALVAEGRLGAEQAAAHPGLPVAGLVGSIDNDLWGTDRTIGCDSALHRIVEALDTLTSTARSHQRAFVVEVMGRRCGYLALAAAVCVDADHALVPEQASPMWREELVAAIEARPGRRKRLVVLAEGAQQVDGTPITAAEVQGVLRDRLGLETRTTVLGHVQRGGAPSAYDRVMSTRLGARAVDHLLSVDDDALPVLLATSGDAIVVRDLGQAIDRTHAVGAAIDEGRFAEAARARGPEFTELVPLTKMLSAPLPTTGRRLLLAHVGAPAPGMNAAMMAGARAAASESWQPWVVGGGLQGVLQLGPRPVEEAELHGVSSLGSTVWGTSRWTADDASAATVAEALAADGIDAVLLVGGYEALRSAAALHRAGVAVGVVPATISNNVPGTELSVGCDTAVNVIVEGIDRLKLSAVGSRDRVFVVEVMGRRCGYLAVQGALGGGAELVYTHEEGVDLARLARDARRLNEAFDGGRQVGLVVLADGASDAYDAAALAKILADEGDGRFDTRVCVLGHLQQGGRPSPQDRLTGVRLATAAVRALCAGEQGVVAGLEGTRVALRTVPQVLAMGDPRHRRPLDAAAELAARRLPAMLLRSPTATA